MVTQKVSKKDMLASVIPTLLERFAKLDHEVGYADSEGDEYETNYFCYDEDGWNIEIVYRCCGKWYIDPGDYWTPPACDLISAWGDVTELTVVHYDDDTDEDIEFSDEDLLELRSELNKIINSIAY